MNKTLSELFVETKGNPILFKSVPTFMLVKIPIKERQELDVSFLYFDNQPRQGMELCVDNNKGNVEANGQIIRRPVFWTDTAPKEFKVICIPKDPSGFVSIWNIWQLSPTTTIHAWTGNAGVQVDNKTPGTYILNCSNGLNEVNFDTVA